MGRHSIPGPDDSPREPFEATPAPQHEPVKEHYPSYEPVDEQHRLETSAAPPSPEDEYSGGRFADGTWQGGHRSTDRKRRGVSVAVIVALVAVVVLVGGIILWRFFGNALSNRSDTAAATCSGSDVPVAVIADPSIADKITEFADRYNKSADPIGDRCGRARGPSSRLQSSDRRLCRQLALRSWSAARAVDSRQLGIAPPGCRRRPARMSSPTAGRWSPPPWCWPSSRNSKPLWRPRIGARCPDCRPIRRRWRR